MILQYTLLGNILCVHHMYRYTHYTLYVIDSDYFGHSPTSMRYTILKSVAGIMWSIKMNTRNNRHHCDRIY